MVLGAIQGLAEWLPVSSEGLIFLIKTNFFPSGESAIDIVRLALFLHLGTFLAALIYFRRDVWRLLKALFAYKKAVETDRKIISFLIISTGLSAVLAFIFLKGIEGISTDVSGISGYVNLVVAGLLLITAVLQIKIRRQKEFGRIEGDLKKQDGVFLGIVQGLAVLPGLSRSGLTVSALLLSEFKDETALKLSFLMSLPIVFLGNIILNVGNLYINSHSLMALLFSFVTGFLTIGLFLKIARKVNFGYFILGFALLMAISVFI